jgi:hypothetical protein
MRPLMFLFCLLWVCSGAPHALGAPPPAAPSSEAHAFQARFLLRLPNMEAKQFIADVTALKNDTDDQADPAETSVQQIALLRNKADALRRHEAQAYQKAAPLLRQMGAPATLQSWIASLIKQLDDPVILSPQEQLDAKTDPNTAEILGVLDESDALKTQTDSELDTFDLWLSLTHGSEGLWAASVGEIAANLQASLSEQKEPQITVLAIRHLYDDAPQGTEPMILRALAALIPAGGNLSSFLPGTAAVPIPAAARSLQELLAQFGAASFQTL